MPEDRPKGGRKPAAPRLVVRRDAHRELEFRYDQEERLSRGTAPNRTAGGQTAGPGPFRRAWTSPLEARRQAMPFEESVYVTLSLRYAGRPGPRVSAERFTVRFLLEP